MKKLTFLFSLMVMFFWGYTQHTLSFNQVLILTNGNSYTVPANTTWKVVSIQGTNQISGSGCSANITPPGGSGANAHFGQWSTNSPGYYSPSTMIAGNSLPMWLPAGTVIQPNNDTRYFSVIEFIIN